MMLSLKRLKMKKSEKYLAAIILIIAAVWFAIYPPNSGHSQPYIPEVRTSIHVDTTKIEKLKILSEEKVREAAELAAKKPDKIVITKAINPETITVYLRLNGEITEHKITCQDGFYILDLDTLKHKK